MQRIRLSNGEWSFDPARQLGSTGGFGAVFCGFSETHGDLAVKRLHLEARDAAHREMRIAIDLAGRSLAGVIPVLDAGEDPDSGSYFVVMSRGEKSLQDDLNRGARFGDEAAALVLLEILDGLVEVADIVHRDLKPANVIFHEGRWKVSDFGIARFVEDCTSARTLKASLSPHYAAPEQWKYIRAEGSADIYALGCVGYALLSGIPPFSGTNYDELRHQHLHADPPTLEAHGPRLRSLLTMMLRKPAEARPSAQRVRAILTDVISAPAISGVADFGLLAHAGANVARAQAQADRAQQEQLSASQIRNELAEASRKILREMVGRLHARIQSEAPMVQVAPSGSAISLGSGSLDFSVGLKRQGNANPAAIGKGVFSRSGWDVVASDEVIVTQLSPRYRWSSSLWYCKLPGTDNYRWYEACYWGRGGANAFTPYSLRDSVGDADLAAAPIMHVHVLAFGPVAIDDENEDEFIERYSTLLALAAEGRIGYPSNLPLHRTFWRTEFLA